MSDLNVFTCTGRLGADPESRTFPDGKPVVNMRVAVSEAWKDRSTGERKENTLWMNVAITNEGLCKVASAYLKKGSRVALSGPLKTRSWDKDGQKHYATELHLSPFHGTLTLLDSAAEGGPAPRQQSSAPAPAYAAGGMDDDIPFRFEWRG